MSTQNVDFQVLKAWISDQEAYEAEHNKPAPLTAAQRSAVAELTKPPPAPMPDVNLDDKDYISILQYFLSASQSQGVSATYSDATPVTFPASPSPYWTQSLTLTIPPSSPVTFPSKSTRTSFPRKKDAKKYAAKLAVDHLLSLSLLVPDPSSPTSYTLPSLSHPKRKGVVGGAVDPNNDNLPATQRVVELCRKLGIQAPVYRLTERGPAGQGTWDGEADFGRDEGMVLLEDKEAMRVEGVFGKQRAKEEMAEGCLAWLMEVQARRERATRAVLGEEDEDGEGVGL